MLKIFHLRLEIFEPISTKIAKYAAEEYDMYRVKSYFWWLTGLASLVWLLSAWPFPLPNSYFPFRTIAVQYTGVISMVMMSLAMILALRPAWPERWIGGLDKMYRLHKWLGIGALVLALTHFLFAQGTKWAVKLGWLTRPPRGGAAKADAAQQVDFSLQALFREYRGVAEDISEWPFYIAIALIVISLVQRIPYHVFFKVHRILALAYLVLVFHSVILLEFTQWLTPLGLMMAVLLAYGTWAALVVLFRRVGAGKAVQGKLQSMQYYEPLGVLETAISLPQGWPGHRPGQFAFAMSNAAEGAHPYTIASAWDETTKQITFITKGLGDHTRRLVQTLKVGMPVRIEGPYGCFDFTDDRPAQIWIGGGIGITPFVARMKYLAQQRLRGAGPTQKVHLFHTTREVDETALDKMRADAAAADVELHIFIDARDGRLTAERIRELVPQWQGASFWFCGPAGFGEALRRDFSGRGINVARHFHQELFAMR